MEFYDKVNFTAILSQNIKKFREMNNLSQRELAKGICSQAQISNMENCIDVPNSFILYKICSRLGISLEVLIEKSFSKHYLDIQEISDNIENLIEQKNWIEIDRFVEFKRNILLNGTNDDNVLYYFGKIVSLSLKFMLNVGTRSDYEQAYKYFTTVKNKLNNCSNVLKLRLYVAMIFIEVSGNNLEHAIKFVNICNEFVGYINEKTSYKHIITFYCNVARIYSYKNDFDSANIYCDKIKSICAKYKTVYSLDVVYAIMAYQYYPKEWRSKLDYKVDHNLAEFYYRKAISVCEILDNHQMADYYKEQITLCRK